MSSVLQFISNQGLKVSQDSKFIVLYFTAHWCPPCKQFSPTFVQSMKAAGKDVDVFLMSRDRDLNQYTEYMKSFEGFNILPFQSEAVSNMMQELGINGIPSVQVFDKQGNLVTDNGRAVIMQNPKDFVKGLQAEIDANKQSALDIIKQESKFNLPQQSKYLGFYFTASWCPPCQSFSPLLVKTLQELNQANQSQFQLIISSCDEDQEGYDKCVEKYKNDSNCHVLPFEDKLMNLLAQKFKIQSIPTLIILNAQNGNVITKNGREDIENNKANAVLKWKL